MINDGIALKDRTLSILMAGQSNMAGRGNLGDVPQIDNPNCYMLRMGRWQHMSDPINVDRALEGIPYPSGVSLAGSFADELEKYLGRKIGLIPCADGGTRVELWQKGEVLYDHAMMQTALARRTSDFGGIIWHQGESNCSTDIKVYKSLLRDMFLNMREDIGLGDIPIVVGELSANISPEWQVGDGPLRINACLHELAEELPRFAVASSENLELKPDGIHFTALSARELGTRYFNEYIKLL